LLKSKKNMERLKLRAKVEAKAEAEAKVLLVR
jgi:hypothetical protein